MKSRRGNCEPFFCMFPGEEDPSIERFKTSATEWQHVLRRFAFFNPNGRKIMLNMLPVVVVGVADVVVVSEAGFQIGLKKEEYALFFERRVPILRKNN